MTAVLDKSTQQGAIVVKLCVDHSVRDKHQQGDYVNILVTYPNLH